MLAPLAYRAGNDAALLSLQGACLRPLRPFAWATKVAGDGIVAQSRLSCLVSPRREKQKAVAVNAGVALLCTNTCSWFCHQSVDGPNLSPRAIAARMRRLREGQTAQFGGLNLARQPHLRWSFGRRSAVVQRREAPFCFDRPRWEASPAEDGRVPLTSLPASPWTKPDQLQQPLHFSPRPSP